MTLYIVIEALSNKKFDYNLLGLFATQARAQEYVATLPTGRSYTILKIANAPVIDVATVLA